MPRSVAEYYSVGRPWTRQAVSLMLTAMMPLCVLESSIDNTFFTNLSTAQFDVDELHVLGLGLNFIPTPRMTTWTDANADYQRFARRIYMFDFFHRNPPEPRADAPHDDLPQFQIPNPDWSPETHVSEYEPSEGVLEYVEETRGAVRCGRCRRRQALLQPAAPPPRRAEQAPATARHRDHRHGQKPGPGGARHR
eukprot:SAG22_NODE_549_length_9239_cov_7.477899_9_plen_194_part_00